jgi:hypothetical protein
VLDQVIELSPDPFNDETTGTGIEGEGETKEKGKEESQMAYCQGDTDSPIALMLRNPMKMRELEETMVVDLTMKSLRDASTKKRNMIEKAMSKTKSEHDLVMQEIEEGARSLEGLGMLVEEKKQKILECSEQGGILCERTRYLERELEELDEKYCEGNEYIKGYSRETSKLILKSAQDSVTLNMNPHCVPDLPPSPILEK